MAAIVEDFNAVGFNQLRRLLPIHWASNQAVLVLGPPGCGKTAFAQSEGPDLIAECLGADREACGESVALAAGMDAFDWRGIPSRRPDGSTSASWPTMFPTDAGIEAGRFPKHGLLILDEIDKAAPEGLAPLHQFLLQQQFGDYRLPAGWRILATGNRMKDSAGGRRLGTALSDRLATYTLNATFDGWEPWARQAKIHSQIMTFHRFKHGQSFYRFDPSSDKNATARGWEMLSRNLHLLDGAKAPDSDYYACAISWVGKEIGAEFNSFRGIFRELPDIKQICKDPDSVPVPDPKRTDLAIALASILAVASAKENLGNVISYVRRLPEEIQSVYRKDVIVALKKVAEQHPAMIKLVADNPGLAEIE